MSIAEKVAFAKKHHHLPGIPSAQELTKTGIDVVKMDAMLLKEIEEIWLHLAELKKENEQLKAENATFKLWIAQQK